MSIYGIGIDLCDIARIEKILQRPNNQAFAKKVLHPQEMKVFDSHRFQARFLAKRFAAKEAFAKALGTGIAEGVTLADVQICNNGQGKPYLVLHGASLKKIDTIGGKPHLSISDERQHAIAQVIIET